MEAWRRRTVRDVPPAFVLPVRGPPRVRRRRAAVPQAAHGSATPHPDEPAAGVGRPHARPGSPASVRRSPGTTTVGRTRASGPLAALQEQQPMPDDARAHGHHAGSGASTADDAMVHAARGGTGGRGHERGPRPGSRDPPRRPGPADTDGTTSATVHGSAAARRRWDAARGELDRAGGHAGTSRRRTDAERNPLRATTGVAPSVVAGAARAARGSRRGRGRGKLIAWRWVRAWLHTPPSSRVLCIAGRVVRSGKPPASARDASHRRRITNRAGAPRRIRATNDERLDDRPERSSVQPSTGGRRKGRTPIRWPFRMPSSPESDSS